MNDGEVKKKIRENLIQCRLENNLTQTDVGRLVGKTKTAVASWEQGKSLPDADTLARLAKYYRKTLSYMYGEEEKDKIPDNTQKMLEYFSKLTEEQQLNVLGILCCMIPDKEK